ncbi:hypothetical protein [Clostridium ganghwense]|uniref:Uncharacterized protein n=1 Tax=Clostridium ganghwense TaxID=312089 RepID=A0ABT4CP00_9CLOT|nr:hypothetical protein [Clostridium ganghwense]MCY6370772.1 hypothetical protein [Clostridium ganghwense]
MQLNTKDMIKQKLLDVQESVRDYEEYAKQVDNSEVNRVFKDFAEESAMQAQKLQQLLTKYDK